MSNTHLSLKSVHMSLMEHISYQAITLTHVQTITFTGNNPCRVLPTVLENCNRVIQVVTDIASTNHTDYAAHIDLLQI
jgi:hypothetical protein